MKKIPTLFVRDEGTNRKFVKNEVNDGCQWVLDGEGIATRKYDGTCFRYDEDGQWWGRREVKPGKDAPENFVALGTDDVTGKTVGWEPAEQSSFYKWLQEALANDHDRRYEDTYELCGPKINGDPEKLGRHELIRHADAEELDAPRDFEGLRSFLTDIDFHGEGIVWHHPDGRMCKLKKRDFRAECL